MMKTKAKTAGKKRRITYKKLFWLFIIGSLLGVLLEGVFCRIRYGAWETHTVAVWGPFCIIYGIGAAGLYACAVWLEKKNSVYRFLMYSLVATVVEYICGALLLYRLNMKAWDYSGEFLNYKGIICLKMTLVWGVAGLLFEKYAVPYLEKLFDETDGRLFKTVTVLLSVFMVVNLSLTVVCMLRWADRHNGIPPENKMEEFVDEKYNDEYMQNRFCEWWFLD